MASGRFVAVPSACPWRGKPPAIDGSPPNPARIQQMDAVYQKIRQIAREIAGRYPQPDFYGTHRLEVRTSLTFLKSDAFIRRLRKEVAGYLENNAGHGVGHAEKVAVDAGALVLVESRLAGQSERNGRRTLLLALCSGLLHDICRKEKFHAKKGAVAAKKILQKYSLTPGEITSICTAIRNHEAYARQKKMPDTQTRIISDCLYDADKFRWGPDNFMYTLWDMVAVLAPPLHVFMARYPKGMSHLNEIRKTFRSQTGRKFGPQFIDIGIGIGEELYQAIMSDFIDPS